MGMICCDTLMSDTVLMERDQEILREVFHRPPLRMHLLRENGPSRTVFFLNSPCHVPEQHSPSVMVPVL